MNNHEFLKEIHNHLDHEYELFNGYQRISNSILVEFDRICRLNGIRYCLAYGTMLGCVRDHQQIPWDYDIDVFVPNTDCNRLLEALNKDLNDDYYYKFTNNTQDYPTTCLRLCKKGYTYMAMHVDVFFLIGCPDNCRDRKRFINTVSRLSLFRIEKNVEKHLPVVADKSLIKRLIHKILSFRYGLYSNRQLLKKEQKLFYMYPFGKTKYCMSYATDRISYDSSLFNNYIEVRFGEILTFIPQGFDEFLKIKFHNYSEYLSVRQRFNEFLSMKHIIDERQEYFEKVNYKGCESK